MSYKNNKLSIATLVNFTRNGVVVATYQEIRQVLTDAFKNIYGRDIDLSSASADGVYVETLCLMISNILQSFKQYYAQLDVRTASGVYLENLCALSNIRRKDATYSTCSVTLTLSNTETQPYVTKEISLADKNGNVWTCSSDSDMTFQPGVAQSLIFTCEEIGPISAPIGWIDKTVNTEKSFTIHQNRDAIIGSYAESDSELRARRNASLGSTGATVLETMVGTLYQLGPILDVKIYNNDTDKTITALDGTTVQVHDIYVIIKKQQNVDIADSKIASAIYEKLTPGIRTTNSSGNNGVAKTYVYKQSPDGTPLESEVVQNVYWKEATPVKPKCVITISTTSNYGSANDKTSQQIAAKVIQYLNGVKLSGQVNVNKLWNVVTYADPKFRGEETYSIDSITFNNGTSIYNLPDTYFNYTESDIKIEDTSSTNNKVVITIGA